MGNTVLTTTYLTAHPEYLALLSRVGVDSKAPVDGDYVQFYLYEDGRLVWKSEELPIRAVPLIQTAQFFCRNSRNVRLFADFTRYRRGYPYRVRSNLGTPRTYVSIRGVGSTAVRFNQTRYPTFVRTARRRVVGLYASLTNTSGRPVRSSTLRPNPESIPTSFTRVDELQNGAGAGNYSISVTPTSYAAFSRSWTGVRTPGYGRMRSRQLPVNPHSVSIKNVLANLAVHKNANPRITFYHLWIDRYTDRYGEPAGPSHIASARNVSIRRLIDNAQLGVNANLMQDVAQINQTLSTITGSASTIARALSQVKRKNFLGAAQTLWRGQTPRYRSGSRPPSFTKSLANNWLQFQYGWKPLMQDIQGALQSLPSLSQAGLGFVARVTASATQRATTSSSFNTWNIPSPVRGTTVTVTQTTCRIGIRYKVASPLMQFLSQTGFTNPINLAWEILPFSFVVDWFTPIGPYLDALSAFDGLEFLDGYQVLFTRENVLSTIHGQSVDASSGGTLQDSQGDYAREWVLLDRTRLTAFPVPTFPTTFRNGLSSLTHAQNALALVKSVFGR